MADDDFSKQTKVLSDIELERLKIQDTRKVSEYKANTLEIEAKKNWDLFYKRNETRFFRDRHWTTREFQDLLNRAECTERVLFEIGCGVGNFIYPLIEEKLNFRIVACDLSPRAIEIVKNNSKYNPSCMHVFQADITTEHVFTQIEESSIDIATLIFVLSAIHPDKFLSTLKNIYKLLKPNGILLFRDYGLYDMAQLRFKAGHKIADNLYMRQDGTRCYYFSIEYLGHILKEIGFEIASNTYIHRRTINKKENIDVPRIFVQCKAIKPD